MSMHVMTIASALTVILATAALVAVLLQDILTDRAEKPAADAEARNCPTRLRAQSIARDWAAFRTMSANGAR